MPFFYSGALTGSLCISRLLIVRFSRVCLRQLNRSTSGEARAVMEISAILRYMCFDNAGEDAGRCFPETYEFIE